MAAPPTIDWNVTIAVSTVPSSTRNMTGLRIIDRGSSMAKERTAAWRTISGSKMLSRRARRRCILKAVASAKLRWDALIWVSTVMRSIPIGEYFRSGYGKKSSASAQARLRPGAAGVAASTGLLGLQGHEVVGNGAEHECRHERQRTHQQNGAHQHAEERQVVGFQCPSGLGDELLRGQAPCQGQRQQNRRESSHQEDKARRHVPRRRIVAQAFESRTVVGARRAELVEDF